MISALSFALGIPENAIALPGAKPDGDASHLSRFPSVHFTVAFADNALEYAKPSLAAMF